MSSSVLCFMADESRGGKVDFVEKEMLRLNFGLESAPFLHFEGYLCVAAVSTYSWALVNVFSSLHTVEPLSKDTPELRTPSHSQDRTHMIVRTCDQVPPS